MMSDDKYKAYNWIRQTETLLKSRIWCKWINCSGCSVIHHIWSVFERIQSSHLTARIWRSYQSIDIPFFIQLWGEISGLTHLQRGGTDTNSVLSFGWKKNE